MRELQTIQTREKLNRVYAVDEKGVGGANHEYIIVDEGAKVQEGYVDDENLMGVVQLQNGGRNIEGSVAGVLDVDLLEIVRDRLASFQEGEFANRYNDVALEHVIFALRALNQRVEDRINRNVLGKEIK